MGLRSRDRRQTGASAAGLVLSLVVIGVLAVAGAEVYATSSGVLKPGDAWIPGDGLTDVTPCEGERCDEVPFDPGGPVSFGQDIRNTGLLPITILGFPGSINAFALIESVETSDSYALRPGDTTPFEPVTIQPNEQVFLVFRGHFRTCDQILGSPDGVEGAAAVQESITLQTRTLLLTHDAPAELHRPLAWKAPSGGDC